MGGRVTSASHARAIRRTCARLASSRLSHGAPEPSRRVLTSQNTSIPAVAQHEIELAEPRAVVAGQDLVAEALEVLGGEPLTAAAEVLTCAR